MSTLDSSFPDHGTPTRGLAPRRAAWRWIPTLYFAEGLPYVVVMTVAVIMYKRLGVSNTTIALYTSWLYLPWVIKPLWSPLVEVFRTRRHWIVLMQLFVGAGLAGVALTIPAHRFLQYTMAFFWLLAFSSATHDVAADGFYMLSLSDNDQAWFVGVRSTFYRLAMIAGQGLLVMLAGLLETASGLPELPIQVRSVRSAAACPAFAPEQFPPLPDGGPQRIVAQTEKVEIGLGTRSSRSVRHLIKAVRNWNVGQGFYELPLANVDRGAKAQGATASDTDQRDAARQDPEVGNAAVVYFRLTRQVPVGETLVVQFGRRRGDASFRVVEGSRFVVTHANAQSPLAAVIQVDPKLAKPATAAFTARSGNFPFAWATTFFVLAGFFLLVCTYHAFILPRPAGDVAQPGASARRFFREFMTPFLAFFRQPRIGVILAFLLCYRFAEAQLAKMAAPFLVDTREVGGLALSTGEVGFVYGIVGVIMLTVGGLLGGFVAAKQGLKYWIWWMVLAINLPNLVYVFLSFAMPQSFLAMNIAVGIEQFGYGFGFTAYMLYMLYVAQGEHQTVHFALCTGFMALGMMIPGMFSGWVQEWLGYRSFFCWVMLATIPGFVVTYLIPLDPSFGKKKVPDA